MAERSRKSITIRFASDTEAAQVKAHARALGLPINTFICRAIEQAQKQFPVSVRDLAADGADRVVSRPANAECAQIRDAFMAGSKRPEARPGRPRKTPLNQGDDLDPEPSRSMKIAYQFMDHVEQLLAQLDTPEAVRALEAVLMSLGLNMLDHDPDEQDRVGTAAALAWIAEEAIRVFETDEQTELSSDESPFRELASRPRTIAFFDALIDLRNQVNLRKHDSLSPFVLAMQTLRMGLKEEPVDPAARAYLVELILAKCASRMGALTRVQATEAPIAPN